MLDWARLRSRVFENSLIACCARCISLGLDNPPLPQIRITNCLSTYVFVAELVHGEVNSAVRPAAYFIFDGILVDDMVRPAVRIVVCIFGPGIEGLLYVGWWRILVHRLDRLWSLEYDDQRGAAHAP